jgi:hypothetical protein
MDIKVKEVVTYGGHSLKANGAVDFTLKAAYSELANSIKLMQMLNNDVNIKAKVPGGKAMKLGMFRVKQIVVDGDGESVLKFNGLNDHIEMDNLNMLPLNDSDTKEFVVLLEAEIEEEDEDAEE